MDERRKKVLVSKIVECLKKSFLSFGRPDPQSISENIKPVTAELFKTHKDWITETEIVIMLYRRSFEILTDLREKETEKEPFLSNVKEENVEPFAISIVEFLATLPRKYYFYYKLSNINHDFFNNKVVTNDIAFLSVNESNIKDMPVGVSEGTYLKICGQGYCDGEKESSASVSAHSKFKQYIYFSILTKKMDLNKWRSYSTKEKNVGIKFLDLNDPTCQGRIDISDSLFKCLNYIFIHKDFLNSLDKPKKEEGAGFIKTILGSVDIPPRMIDEKIKTILESSENDINTSSLKNATEWGFDSKTNDFDDTLAFMQLSIALEAILGVDSNKDGVTERLADRCAYLIGRNVEDRAKIRKEFERFYNIRSHLIHGRVKRLKGEEFKMFFWGAWTLDRIISREIFTLPSNQKTFAEALIEKSLS